MSEVKLMGFSGPNAYSVIFWQMDGENQAKTVCYTAEEEQAAISRFHTVGDFYKRYDKAVVIYPYKSPVEYERIEKRGA